MTNKRNIKKVGKLTASLIIETREIEGNANFENIGINVKHMGNMEHLAVAIHQAIYKFPELGKCFDQMQKATIITAENVKDLVKANEEIKQAQEVLVEAATKSMEVAAGNKKQGAGKKQTGNRKAKGKEFKGLKVVKDEKEVEGEK